MEELPDYKRIKGVLDRSFIYNFVPANIDYNIKDVIRCAGDQEYKKLYEEIIHIRKLLFAFRLVRYEDVIPEVKLNIIHRNAELTKPLLRLFSYRNDSSITLEKIRLALSKFILGRNESKKNSIESKLLETINNLIERCEYEASEEYYYSFSNERIRSELRTLMEGTDIPGKQESFYSAEYGAITHKRITMLYKSKLKGESVRDSKTGKRGLKFSKDVLKRLVLYYDVPTEIEIIVPTLPTDPTHSSTKQGSNNDNSEQFDNQNHAQITSDTTDNNDVKEVQTSHKSVG